MLFKVKWRLPVVLSKKVESAAQTLHLHLQSFLNEKIERLKERKLFTDQTENLLSQFCFHAHFLCQLKHFRWKLGQASENPSYKVEKIGNPLGLRSLRDFIIRICR